VSISETSNGSPGTGITSHSLRAVSNKSSTPQIFIGGGYIGGTDELEQHFK
jgi:glutaredoxin